MYRRGACIGSRQSAATLRPACPACLGTAAQRTRVGAAQQESIIGRQVANSVARLQAAPQAQAGLARERVGQQGAGRRSTAAAAAPWPARRRRTAGAPCHVPPA